MASSKINLDNLIKGHNDEDGICLNIADPEDTKEVGSDSGTDSSYGEFAKSIAQNIDKIIDEVELDREEKNKRLAAARHQRAKQEDQRGFKKKTGGSSKGVKASNASNGPLGNVQRASSSAKSSTSAAGQVVIGTNPEKIDSSLVQPKVRTKKYSKTKPKDSPVDEATKPKSKNVTIQDFGIETSPSDSDLDVADYGQVTGCSEKSFKVKSLNRTDLDKESSSSGDSDDELSQTTKAKFFQSAEKSAAAKRRKRSEYLKKRRSNFRASQSIGSREIDETDTVDTGSLPKQDDTQDNRFNKQVDPRNRSDRRRNLGEIGSRASLDEPSSSKRDQRGLNQRSRVARESGNYSGQESKKNARVISVSETKDNSKSKKKGRNAPKVNGDVKTRTREEDTSQSTNRRDLNLTPNSETSSNVKKGKKESQGVKGVKNQPQNSEVNIWETLQGPEENAEFSFNFACPAAEADTKFQDDGSSKDAESFVVLDIKFNKESVRKHSPLLDLERSMNSSENEIDWEAMEEMKNRKISVNLDSDEDVDIDFKAIADSRKAKNSCIKTEPAAKGDSSSDFEAQFDACLQQLNKLK